ncbi:MAG: PAS domain S-box protein [Granulosicoccus sp.]|nr:PAS domain S-box protein [Granulosicoccus sp.]
MQSPLNHTIAQGNVISVGLQEQVLSTLYRDLPEGLELEALTSSLRLSQQVEHGILQSDVVLLDSSVEEPIRVAQRVHSFDKTIPVIILSPEERCSELRRAVMYSPLLGSEVTPWPMDDTPGLVQALANAVVRHKQRRKYLDTISSVQPKLGNLTLSQPEVGHYLGRLLNQAPIGVISVDAEGSILAINRHAVRLLGTSERETMGVKLVDYFVEGSREGLSNLLMRSAVAQVFGTKPEILERVVSDAQIRYLEVSATPVAYQAERRGYMVIVQDVTERERAELQRKKSEELMGKLSSALEQAADSVMITDKNRVIEYVNPAFESLTGYSRSEAIGRKTYFLRSGVQDAEFYGELWRVISGGNVFRGEFVNRKKDGREYHEEKTITPLRDAEGNITHYVSTGHDITDRLIAEKAIREHRAELAHVSRLSTLGEMTSGLAHELNQPLCAITTYAQTCLRVLEAEGGNKDKLRYGLEQVIAQAKLSSEIFERLRDFSRKRVLPKRSVDMLHIVNEVRKLSNSDLKTHGITFCVSEQSGCRFMTLADPIQLEQVLLNLLRNSIDAVSDLSPDRKQINLDMTLAGEKIKVALSDRGKGCQPEVAERLFEPFFTTKPSGLGIGLGISQSIIEDHGGELFLEKSSAEGATFSFTLPVSDEDSQGGEVSSDSIEVRSNEHG